MCCHFSQNLHQQKNKKQTNKQKKKKIARKTQVKVGRPAPSLLYAVKGPGFASCSNAVP